jgi:hypothetical protein
MGGKRGGEVRRARRRVVESSSGDEDVEKAH